MIRLVPVNSLFPLEPTGNLNSEWIVHPFMLYEAFPVVAVNAQEY